MDDAVMIRNIENEMKSDESTFMLPGFRFHPTDEELVGFYLKRKIMHKPLSIELIKQLDIYKYDPWDLPKLATTGEKEWYFYCPRDRKYRNSARPNRVTGAGFWKATGTDRPIYSSEGASRCIGLKKSLVFYRGRAAKGIKTDWMMHEFRLPASVPDSVTTKKYLDKNIPTNEAWAICRIFKKANSSTQRALSHSWASPIYHDHITTATATTSENTHTINPFIMSSSSNNIIPPKISNQPFHFPPCRPLYDLAVSENTTRPFAGQFTVIPESYNIDASLLLQDMSTSVFGEVFVKGSGNDVRDEFNGFSTVNVMPEDIICHAVDDKESIIGTTSVVGGLDDDDKEWGVIRSATEYSSYNLCEGYWNRSLNPMWDYSSPSCPADQLSTAYSTNNIYT